MPGDDQEEEYGLKELLRDMAISTLALLLILSGIYVYTQNWPPIVVVISSSMEHGLSESHVGTIDIGDIVMVKKVESRHDIITWVEGKRIGYSTYGNYGDVVVYRKNGGSETPVIHRAIVWVEVNSSDPEDPYNVTFDVPELHLYGVRSIKIENYPFFTRDGTRFYSTLYINLNTTIENFRVNRILPHGGLITKGDNNINVDQVSLIVENPKSNNFRLVEPVKLQWIVGKAVGELPWMGLIKLYATGEINPQDPPPENSWTMLFISLAFIFTLPVLLEFLFNVIVILAGKGKGKGEEEDDNRGDKEGDKKVRSDERHRPRR